MSLPIIAFTLFAGNYLNKTISERKAPQTEKVEKNQIPNGPNIYSSNKLEEVNQVLLNELQQNYKKAEDPVNTGVLPPHFNVLNAVGYDNSDIIGLTSIQQSKLEDINKISTVSPSPIKPISNRPMFQEFTQEPKQEKIIQEETSLLTGKPLDRKHSNMTPFFGSNIRQNTEQFTNDSVLSAHTGVSSLFKHKQEAKPFFEPMNENIYGTPVITETVIVPERYEASRFRNNVNPFEEKKISAPTANTIDNNIRPVFKDVNDLRVANHQKETYAGKIIQGQKGSVRGAQSSFEKNRPPTFRETGSLDNWFRGPGSYTAKKQNEDYQTNLPSTQRQDSIEYYGGIASESSKPSEYYSTNPKNALQSRTEESKRENYEADSVRNISGYKTSNDLGKSGYSIADTERGEKNDYFVNVHRKETGIRTNLQDSPKITQRETLSEKIVRGNVKTSFDRNTMDSYDAGLSENKVRTTTKEQIVKNKYLPQVSNEKGMGYIVNKYTAQTTEREIQDENSNYFGHADGIETNMSRENYSNAEIRDTKEESLKRDRASGPQKFQISGSKNVQGETKITDKMILKETTNQRKLAKTSLPQNISSKDTIGDSMKIGDEIKNPRFHPEIIQSQIKKNPYALKPHFYNNN
jgi:hypothetical protein